MNKNIAIINSIITTPYDKQILDMINSMLAENKDINADVYTTSMNISMPNKKFGILPIYEAKYFKGTAIVWDLITLDLVHGFPNLSEVIYIHSNTIPWRENSNVTYKTWENLFVNNKLKTIISDQNIHEIFRLTWRTGVLVQSIDNRTIYETIQQAV